MPSRWAMHLVLPPPLRRKGGAEIRGCMTAVPAVCLFVQQCRNHTSATAVASDAHDCVGHLSRRNEDVREEKALADSTAITTTTTTTTTTGRSQCFSLGNGVEVRLPALSSLSGYNNTVTLEGDNFGEDELASALEMMPETLEPSLCSSFSVAKVAGDSKDAAARNAQLNKTFQRWPDVLHRLRTVALPLLLHVDSTTSPAGGVDVASVSEALQIVKETLDIVDAVSGATGLRASRMFPAHLVAVLWNRLRYLYKHVAQHPRREKHHGPSAPKTVGSPPSLMKELKAIRRALALRTRELNDLFPPTVLVQILLCIEQCGALSDDIIGPVGTQLLRRHQTSAALQNGPQHVATNHLLSTRFVAPVVDTEKLPFQGEYALSFACLLGRAHVKNHFQLHRLMHTILLPSVMAVLESSPPEEMTLFELTRCYFRYAVSGSATMQLTSLWMPHILHMKLDKCSELLRIFGNSNRGNVAVGAEEDYLILIEAILERATFLCHQEENQRDRLNVLHSEEALVPLLVQSSDEANRISVESMAKFMCSLATVNSTRWVEVYLLAATALERNIDGVKISDVAQLTKALLRRNSHLPYHPLHARLAHRLLMDKKALTNVELGGLSLLATALMSPALLTPSRAEKETRTTARTTSSASSVSSSSQVPSAEQTDAPVPAPAVVVSPSADRALAVFRRHGTKLGLRSFVAGMCVSPLAQLPRRSQESVMMHFTSIATAVEVSWLVKGIVALTGQIPEVVDPLSVQRWFSRFTAVDVASQLDIEHAAMLLNILSDDNYSRDCALAKQAIVKRVSILLLEESIPLDAVVPLAMALQRANVFFPYLYSRVCRLLLANVRQAPWKLFLPAFHVIADEFTRRQHGNGSVFRDVWEQLRTRVIDEAALSLEAEDVISALNGFAALDVNDRPVFSVLLHRLCTIYQSLAASVEAKELSATSTTESSSSSSLVLNPAVWADNLFSSCTPSALATLITTLVHVGDGGVVDVFMPWVLLRAQPVVKDLYPIDVLHLMPALLSCFTSANAVREDSAREDAATSWLCSPMNHAILHATYDTCRELFLRMYEDVATARDPTTLQTERAEWAPKVHVSVSHVPRYLFAELLIALCQCGVQDEAVAAAAASRMTRRACVALPIGELVNLTMALCFHFPPPPPPPPTTLPQCMVQEEDTVSGKETTTCLPSCNETEENDSFKKTSLSLPAPHQRFLPPILTALWDRVEELQPFHMDALVRCLEHYYGNKVDVDFLDRLMKHRKTIAEVRANPKRQHEKVEEEEEEEERRSGGGGENEKVTGGLSVTTKEDTKGEVVLPSELTAEDLFTT